MTYIGHVSSLLTCCGVAGLVNNLSSSFTKWRRNSAGGGGGHNASQMSDKSCMSLMADRSVAGGVGDVTLGSYDSAESVCGEGDVTPKVLRKRKAEDDSVPFSASKK